MGKVTNKGMQAALNKAKGTGKPTPAHLKAREELGWHGTPKSKGLISDIDKEYRELRRKGKDVVGTLKEKFYDPYMSVFGKDD